MTLGCPPRATAPFGWQPGRGRLRGLGSFGAGTNPYGGPPVGAGAGPGAEVGAAQGAAIASVVPGIGTAVGAIAGAIVGAIAGSINKKDPEQYNFDAAVALWQQNPDLIYNIGNKYLVLAGLFDLNLDKSCSSRWCIPMYVRYGHMGEQRFVTDFVQTIYSAAQGGQISGTDTPQSIMARIVQPWINSWGLGPLNDPHADLINRLLTGMVWDYTDGSWRQNWRARSGDFPFSSLPMFALAQPAPAAPSSAPAQPAPPPVNPIGSQAVPPPSTTPSLPTVSSVGPVGGTMSVQPSPLQLVASIPQVGAPVSYAPDMSANGAPFQLPAGLTFVGLDPNTRSWVLQNASGQQLVLWGGSLMPYTSSTFASQFAPGAFQTAPMPSATVGTTSAGAPVTQASLQSLVSQLAAQGQSAQQAYNSALQALQSNGVAATPQVQQAVQAAVASTPAPSGIGAALSGISTTGWIIIGGGLFLLLSNRRH